MGSERVCMQWSLVIYNTISVLLGLVGAAIIIYEMYIFEDEDANLHLERIVQLTAAAGLVICAIVGCCGAINGSIKVLCLFMFLLFTLIMVHGWKLWRYNEAKRMESTERMVTYTWIKELVRAGAMNDLQVTYECCGKKGSSDYTSMGLPIPVSCHRIKNDVRAIYPYGEGCISAVKRSYLQFYRYGKWTHVGFICYEIFGILISIILSCLLSTKTRMYYY